MIQAFPGLLLLASALSCTPEPAARDSRAQADTAPLLGDSGEDTDTPAPTSLPYAGTFSLQQGDSRCEGLADAVVIGAANIAGNAECDWTSGETLTLTLSGRVAEDGSASGEVASPQWLLSWRGTWTPQTLSGDFQDPKTSPPLSGSFTLNAER